MKQHSLFAFFAACTMFACGSSADSNDARVDSDESQIEYFHFKHRSMMDALHDHVGLVANGATNPPPPPPPPPAPAPTPSSDPPPAPVVVDTTPAAPPPSSLYTTGVKYRGINRAGAEYGDDWSGWTGSSYFEWPSLTGLPAELAYLDSIGFNTVRLPISWERLQHSLGGELNSTYVSTLTSTVAQMTAAGFQVIVDLHNYNRYATGTFTSDQGTTQKTGYAQHVLGDGTLTNAHVIDVWTRLAGLFKDNARVAFELMNEPHDFPLTSESYFALVNDQIAAVRATGATNLVIVPNSRASDITHWASYAPNGGSLDSVAALAVTDPANNYAFVVHQYDDSPTSATQYRDMLTTITTWARTNGKRLFLTELGVTATSGNGGAAVTNVLQYLNDNADVWLGWTPWNLTPYAITGTSYVSDGNAMAWYKPFLSPGTATAGR